MNLKNLSKYIVFGFVLVVFASCDRNRNTTGWEYFDDMVQSPAYETYTPNPNFADGKTMRNPVEGTIALGETPFLYEKTPEDRIRAGKELVDPFEVNEKNLARGKEVFQIFCKDCHGDNGDGKGYMYTSGKYPYPPANLLSEKMMKAPEGEIFHVVTLGFGVMPKHGPQIRPEDRWKVAMYVKNVLQRQQ